MKKIKLEKLSPICWITFMGLLTLAVVTTGCGHSHFNAQPNVQASPVVQGQTSPPANPADLSQVSLSAINFTMTDAAVLAYELIRGELIIRKETYVNENSTPVWVWVRPSFGGLHFWGLCSAGRAQYQANASSPVLTLDGARVVSKDLPMGGWGAFELGPGATATLKWVTGAQWAWIQGPYPAPGESCNQSFPQRGWAGFQFDGGFSEDVRVSLPETPYNEATGDRNFLDSSRVLAQPEIGQGLHAHWGDWP